MKSNEHVDGFVEFLSGEGYRPEIDSDGDVQFKYESGSYFLILNEKDAGYVRLVYPNFWSLETVEERHRAVAAAERATAETKVAKVYVVRENVWAAVEAFSVPVMSFKDVLPRSLRAIRTAVAVFVKNMKESEQRGFVGRA